MKRSRQRQVSGSESRSKSQDQVSDTTEKKTAEKKTAAKKTAEKSVKKDDKHSDKKSDEKSKKSERDRKRRPQPVRLSWPKKLGFAAVTVFLVLGLLEGGLWLFGVRPVIATEDPYVGFTSLSPLFVETEDEVGDVVMETAANKRNIFNVQSFQRDKPKNTYRIFTLGGSTTLGRPYDDKTSFSGWLREFLRQADDTRKWDVINCGGESYASYREAILVEEACQYKPDLFIVYGSHNEFLERRTYHTVIETPPVIRGLGALASRTHLYAAAHWAVQESRGKRDDENRDTLESEVRTRLDSSVGPADFSRDDEQRKQIVEHYRYNLARIVDTARANGADVLFISPAANLRSCSPFKSEHSAAVAADDAKRAAYDQAYDKADASLKASIELVKVVSKLNLEKREKEAAKENAKASPKDKPAESKTAEPNQDAAKQETAKQESAKNGDAKTPDGEVDLADQGALAIYTELNAALDAINRAIAIDDRYAAGHYLRGQILDQLALYDEAKAAYERALDEDVCPLRAISELPKAMADVAGEREVELIDFAEIVARVSPNGIADQELFMDHVHPTIDGNRLLAQQIVDWMLEKSIVHNTGDWNQRTKESVRRQVESRIDRRAHGEALRNLSKVLEWAGKYKESTWLAQQAAELAPTDVESYFRMANGAAKQGQYDKALEFYQLCLRGDPKAAVTYNAAGGVYEAKGEFEKALDYYRKAIGFATERGELRVAVQARTLVGGALMKLNRLADAEEELRRAISADPKYAEAYNKLSLVYARQKRFDDALAKSLEAQQIDRKNAAFIRNEASYLIALKKYEQAKLRLLAALEIERGNAETYATLADTHLQLGEVDAAEQAYRRALSFAPRFTDARIALANLLASKHEFRNADKLLAEYDHPRTLEASAQFAFRLASDPDASDRDGELAVAIAERVRKHKEVESKSAVVQDLLAAAYAEVGRFDDAVTAANLAVAAAVEAKENAFADAVKARLEGYRQKKPYRDPALANPPE